MKCVVLFVVPVEMPVINKERLGGYYRLSAYYLAKVTSQSTVVLLLPSMLFTVIYWLSGLNYGFSVFIQMFLTLFISCLISQVCHSVFSNEIQI